MKNPARVAVEIESREKETIRIKETDIKETLVFIIRSKCMDGDMKKKANQYIDLNHESFHLLNVILYYTYK